MIDRHQQWDLWAKTYEQAIRCKIRPRLELKTRYLEIQEVRGHQPDGSALGESKECCPNEHVANQRRV